MTDNTFLHKLLWPILTILSSGGVYFWIYKIILDGRSRSQIGEILYGNSIWLYFKSILLHFLKYLNKNLGGIFTLQSLNICLAITFFYTVIALATSELSGSEILLGNSKLLEREISPPGSMVLLGMFSIFLCIMVLIGWKRLFVVQQLKNMFKIKNNSTTLLAYWILRTFGWSLLGFVVWTVASQALFNACLIIGALTIFGSLTKITRILSLIIAFILPLILIYVFPNSTLAVFLLLVYVIITPIKGIWDWLSIGINRFLLQNILNNQYKYGQIIKNLVITFLWAGLALVGVAFTLAFAIQIFNNIISRWGTNQIQWHEFYQLAFISPLKEGVFFSTMLITTLLPSLFLIIILCVTLLLFPLPGRYLIRSFCLKIAPTTLEKNWIVLYILFSIILRISLSVILVKAIWLIITRLGTPMFFGSLDLVRQFF